MITAVALSGGVDSLLALALALARERGEVLAVHAHFIPPDGEAGRRARGLARICRDLGVPFHVIDLSREFEERIIAPFVRDYLAGLTPNPCALCNPRMKFGLLMDRAFELGADRLATGHYASVRDDPVLGPVLARGADKRKDQSYFLSLTPGERFSRIVFPLAEREKAGVVRELERRGLSPLVSGESQEICFIPNDDYVAFIQDRVGEGGEPGGPIVLADGRELGRHHGLWRYTLGQRRGLGVAFSEPLYVTGKDLAGNRLVVGVKDELARGGCLVREVNFLVPWDRWPETVLVQTRYRQTAGKARADYSGGLLRLELVEPQSLPTPGQIAAVYDESGLVLAGGTIHDQA